MAVNFVQQKKKQKYMLYIAGIAFLATIAVLYFGYFRETSLSVVSSSTPITPTAEIQTKLTIDLSVFDNPLLDKLEDFVVIPPFTGTAGRTNPFLPY